MAKGEGVLFLEREITEKKSREIPRVTPMKGKTVFVTQQTKGGKSLRRKNLRARGIRGMDGGEGALHRRTSELQGSRKRRDEKIQGQKIETQHGGGGAKEIVGPFAS